MTTLKLKVTNERKPLDIGHVPHFMQPRFGVAVSIAFERAGSMDVEERWARCDGFITEAIPATALETSLYQESKDAEFLAAMNEPDPVANHGADVWDDLIDDEEFRRVAA